jgi:hypothetical protein
VTVAGRTVRRLTPAEVDERRRNGQCFNCDEKYVRGHNRVCAKLFSLEIHDDDDSLELEDPAEQPRISLIAIAGVRSRDTMQVLVRFCAVTVTALLDSGSTHNFVSAPAAARCGLCFIPRTNISVTVANGDKVPATGVFRDTPFSINNEAFWADFFVLPLGGYDLVLGTDWLATLGPILWDFGRQVMSFWHFNHHVRWHGVAGLGTSQLRVCSMEAARELLDLLLTEFEDIFASPAGLPPPRARDHRIHLLPDTAPVAVRPYRYPLLHKDELERQCHQLEQQGLIRRSTSTFSAPVLLVKKGDGTWRLCVDYRALNERTVKNKFPIPVVEELLDELRRKILHQTGLALWISPSSHASGRH